MVETRIEKDPTTGRMVEAVYSEEGERLGGRYISAPDKPYTPPQAVIISPVTTSGQPAGESQAFVNVSGQYTPAERYMKEEVEKKAPGKYQMTITPEPTRGHPQKAELEALAAKGGELTKEEIGRAYMESGGTAYPTPFGSYVTIERKEQEPSIWQGVFERWEQIHPVSRAYEEKIATPTERFIEERSSFGRGSVPNQFAMGTIRTPGAMIEFGETLVGYQVVMPEVSKVTQTMTFEEAVTAQTAGAYWIGQQQVEAFKAKPVEYTTTFVGTMVAFAGLSKGLSRLGTRGKQLEVKGRTLIEEQTRRLELGYKTDPMRSLKGQFYETTGRGLGVFERKPSKTGEWKLEETRARASGYQIRTTSGASPSEVLSGGKYPTMVVREGAEGIEFIDMKGRGLSVDYRLSTDTVTSFHKSIPETKQIITRDLLTLGAEEKVFMSQSPFVRLTKKSFKPTPEELSGAFYGREYYLGAEMITKTGVKKPIMGKIQPEEVWQDLIRKNYKNAKVISEPNMRSAEMWDIRTWIGASQQASSRGKDIGFRRIDVGRYIETPKEMKRFDAKTIADKDLDYIKMGKDLRDFGLKDIAKQKDITKFELEQAGIDVIDVSRGKVKTPKAYTMSRSNIKYATKKTRTPVYEPFTQDIMIVPPMLETTQRPKAEFVFEPFTQLQPKLSTELSIKPKLETKTQPKFDYIFRPDLLTQPHLQPRLQPKLESKLAPKLETKLTPELTTEIVPITTPTVVPRASPIGFGAGFTDDKQRRGQKKKTVSYRRSFRYTPTVLGQEIFKPLERRPKGSEDIQSVGIRAPVQSPAFRIPIADKLFGRPKRVDRRSKSVYDNNFARALGISGSGGLNIWPKGKGKRKRMML